jgi:hypothetical protein
LRLLSYPFSLWEKVEMRAIGETHSSTLALTPTLSRRERGKDERK